MSRTKDYLAAITPAVDGPYRAKTTDIRENIDGTVQSRVLIHDWTGKNGRLICIVDDMGDGAAPRFDYNPNDDATDIVAAYKSWLRAAYPSDSLGWAQELAYQYFIAMEGTN